MSFPRSGNHLLRTLIEVMSARPTVGSPGNHKDLPIHRTVAAQGTGNITIRNPTPIGFKSHRPPQAVQYETIAPGVWGLIYLTRDPREAIASHAARGKPRLPDRLPIVRSIRYRRRVRDLAKRYEDTLSFCESFAPARRFHFRFEDLTDPLARHQTIKKLAAIMHLQPPDADDLDAIYEMARTAQSSLQRRRHKQKARIAGFVPPSLHYDRLLHRIEQADSSTA